MSRYNDWRQNGQIRDIYWTWHQKYLLIVTVLGGGYEGDLKVRNREESKMTIGCLLGIAG